jgi:hypothetical protein
MTVSISCVIEHRKAGRHIKIEGRTTAFTYMKRRKRGARTKENGIYVRKMYKFVVFMCYRCHNKLGQW